LIKRFLPNEFLYQVFALIVTVIMVHAFYVTVVRPRADAVLEGQAAAVREDVMDSPDPSCWGTI
jgi:hypothetical protein